MENETKPELRKDDNPTSDSGKPQYYPEARPVEPPDVGDAAKSERDKAAAAVDKAASDQRDAEEAERLQAEQELLDEIEHSFDGAQTSAKLNEEIGLNDKGPYNGQIRTSELYVYRDREIDEHGYI